MLGIFLVIILTLQFVLGLGEGRVCERRHADRWRKD
jgi:hypothetical protein